MNLKHANQYQKRGRLYLILSLLLLCLLGIAGLYFFKFSADPKASSGQSSNTAYNLAKVIEYFYKAQDVSAIILLQNDAELRPSGGFITAVGSFTINNANINDLKVEAGRAFEKDQTLQPPLPSAYAKYITTPYLTLKDANLSPDFAISASNVSRLYEKVRFHKPELIISINTSTNEKFLDITGPVTFYVNGHELTLDKNNVTDELERLTDLDFATLGLTEDNRKEILAAYSEALLPKLQQQIKEHPFEMLDFARELLKNYDLQIWSTNPELQKHLESLNTAQRIKSHAGKDSLMIVDVNLSSRKTDPFIKQAVSYEVTLADDVTTKLTINYENTASEGPLTTDYNDYLHVYVPYGSELVNSDGISSVEVSREVGRTLITGLFTVPVGTKKQVTLTYKMPSYVYEKNNETFYLAFDKQSGGHIFPINYIIYVDEQQTSIRFDSSHDQILNIENPSLVR